MYESSLGLVMYLLVDGETDHGSYGTVGNGEWTRQSSVYQSICRGDMVQNFSRYPRFPVGKVNVGR